MPYHMLLYDSDYENEHTIGEYDGILEGFDYYLFKEGNRFKGKIPDSVRLYIREGDENLPQASLLANPLHWLIFSERLLNFAWPLIKTDVQVFNAPVYFRCGDKVVGYKLLNPIRIIDCIDWERTEENRREDGTILGVEKIYIKENIVGNHHLFKLKDCKYPVIVSDQLAKGISKRGFKGIAFKRCGVSP